MKQSLPILTSLIFVLLLINITSYGQMLDTTFGTNGSFQDTYTIYPEGLTRIAPDGKIVHLNGYTDNLYDTGVLVRYTQDGIPDPTFGIDGYLEFSYGGGFSTARSMIIGSDNKIYVAGTLFQQPWIKRFLPNGTLDPSFGNGGTRNLGDDSDLQSIRIEKFKDTHMIASHGYTNSSGSARAAMSKFDLDGQLDLTFGNGGIRFFPDLTHFLRFLTVTDNGDIYIGYTDFPEAFDLIMKFDSNGNQDLDFGDGGELTFGVAEDIAGRLHKIREDQHGNIYFLGSDNPNFFVLKTDPLGNPISDFGTNGRFEGTWGTETVILSDVIFLDDGGFLINGTGTATDESNVFISAYLADGSINTQFGTNGVLETDHGTMENTHLLTFNKNNTLLQTGVSGRFQDFEADFFATRYIYEESLSSIEIDDIAIHISPNPVADQLYITNKSDKSIEGWSLYNSQGQILKAGRNTALTQKNITVGVEALQNGPYYIRLDLSGGGQLTKKWLKGL